MPYVRIHRRDKPPDVLEDIVIPEGELKILKCIIASEFTAPEISRASQVALQNVYSYLNRLLGRGLATRSEVFVEFYGKNFKRVLWKAVCDKYIVGTVIYD